MEGSPHGVHTLGDSAFPLLVIIIFESSQTAQTLLFVSVGEMVRLCGMWTSSSLTQAGLVLLGPERGLRSLGIMELASPLAGKPSLPP